MLSVVEAVVLLLADVLSRNPVWLMLQKSVRHVRPWHVGLRA